MDKKFFFFVVLQLPVEHNPLTKMRHSTLPWVICPMEPHECSSPRISASTPLLQVNLGLPCDLFPHGFQVMYSPTAAEMSAMVLSCICLCVCESKAISAKSKSFSCIVSVHWIPFPFSSVILFMIRSISKRSKKGGSKQLCLTLVLIWKLFVTPPAWMTLAFIPSYTLFTTCLFVWCVSQEKPYTIQVYFTILLLQIPPSVGCKDPIYGYMIQRLTLLQWSTL